MKRLTLAVLGLLLAAGCSSSSSAPSSTPTAQTVRLAATLSPANENPPITNAESTGSGTAAIDLILSKDANGAVTGAVVNFTSVTLAGFPSTAVINIAHIHTGATGANGPVLVNTTLAAGDVVLTGGAGSFSRNNITTLSTTDAQAIIANPAGFYFNVHSTLNPGGVVRGQLRAN
jgi:hypothetical protein